MSLLQSSFEERAAAPAQSHVMQEEVFGGDPGAAVGAQAAAGDEVMDVGMKDQGAAPGVEHAQHPELGAEASGIGGQVVQGLGTGGEEQIQEELQMGADQPAQFIGHGEGGEEIRRGQKQARPLALEPGVGVGLAAERTMPVVAGMVAVVKAAAVRAGEELSAAGRGAAGEDRLQNLPLPRRHGGAEAPEILRGQAREPLMDGEAWAAGGGRVAHKSPMNWSRRF
jgi:hypothetical protein